VDGSGGGESLFWREFHALTRTSAGICWFYQCVSDRATPVPSASCLSGDRGHKIQHCAIAMHIVGRHNWTPSIRHKDRGSGLSAGTLPLAPPPLVREGDGGRVKKVRMKNSQCRVGAKPSIARSRCTWRGGTNRFRDFDAHVWSARSKQTVVGPNSIPSAIKIGGQAVPFPLERGRGASKRFEHQGNRALRDRDAHSREAQLDPVNPP